MTLLLDGRELGSEADFHAVVADASGYAFYGHNLDALYDLITRIVEPPIHIGWINAALSRERFETRFDTIVEILREAEAVYGADEYSFVLEM